MMIWKAFTAFQIAVVDWLNSWQHQPDVVHCHDYHTGLIPFMMKYCYAFNTTCIGTNSNYHSQCTIPGLDGLG